MLAALFDRRYPDLTVYPGVHQFALELMKMSAYLATAGGPPSTNDSSDDSDDERDPYGSGSKKANSSKRGRRKAIAGRIAFLTARPELLRKRSTKELRHCGFTHFTRKGVEF